jgi:hypothetical protein
LTSPFDFKNRNDAVFTQPDSLNPIPRINPLPNT